ncbi:MAG: hypothetical protein IKL00_09370, partial [Oscillospiraceae bacterium]|nr:hypothetical protein [Oscillospiraceae bacterium]
SACKADALPAELSSHRGRVFQEVFLPATLLVYHIPAEMSTPFFKKISVCEKRMPSTVLFC